MSKAPALYRALHRWGNFYLYTRLHSVREACQQEIAAARKEAEDWVTSNFNFDNFPALELKGLQLVLPDNALLAAEEQSSVQLERQVYEESWDKVHCSIKNAAYEMHRAWSDSSAFASAQPHSNVGPNASVIMELECSLQGAEHECEARSKDLECTRNSVCILQEENQNLHRDLDAMYERLQTMCSSQQPPDPADPGNVIGDEKEESPYEIRSVEAKVLDASISQSQPTMVGTVSKDIIQVIQKEVGGAKTVHRFWYQAALDILLVSIYLTVISYGYD